MDAKTDGCRRQREQYFISYVHEMYLLEATVAAATLCLVMLLASSEVSNEVRTFLSSLGQTHAITASTNGPNPDL